MQMQNDSSQNNKNTAKLTRRQRARKNNKKRKNGKGSMIALSQPQNNYAIAKERANFFKLSPCSTVYLKALCDPFAFHDAVCIPDLLDVPSLKTRTMIRGAMVVGTAGVGFLVFTSSAYSNDAIAGLVTDAAFAGTALTVSTVVGVTEVYNGQFPYTKAVVDSDLSVRTVACGLRIRYMGTELNRAGRITCIAVNTASQFGDGASVSSLLALTDARAKPVTRSWCGVSFFPRRQADYDYKTPSLSGSGIPTNALTNGDLVFMVDGCVAGTSFDYEYVQYTEIVPNPVGGNNIGISIPGSTTSHSDIPGLAQMRGFFEKGVMVDPGPSLLRQAYNWIASTSPQEVSRFVDNAASVRTGVKLLTGL